MTSVVSKQSQPGERRDGDRRQAADAEFRGEDRRRGDRRQAGK